MKVLISLCLLLGSCQVQQAPHSVVLSPARGTVNYIPLQAPLTPCSDMLAGCYWYVTNSGQGRGVGNYFYRRTERFCGTRGNSKTVNIHKSVIKFLCRVLGCAHTSSPQPIAPQYLHFCDGDGTPDNPFTHVGAHGELDKVSSTELHVRLQLAPLAQSMLPGTGTCGRCRLPWYVVYGHSTKYTYTSSCFPLCNDCWTELGTPENRWPYYDRLIKIWEEQSPTRDYTEKREIILKAVLEGK